MRAPFYVCVVTLIGCVCLLGVNGQTPSALPGFDEPTSITIPDIMLRDQDNRKVKLYRDVMKGKLVVLNFFYTKCEGVCSTSGYWLSKLQGKLGDRLNRDVIIVSISIDPRIDTPQKLQRWGKYWKRRPGWTLLTSTSNDLKELMKEFKPYPSKGVHSPSIFIGVAEENPVRWVALDILSEGDLLLNYLKSK